MDIWVVFTFWKQYYVYCYEHICVHIFVWVYVFTSLGSVSRSGVTIPFYILPKSV